MIKGVKTVDAMQEKWLNYVASLSQLEKIINLFGIIFLIAILTSIIWLLWQTLVKKIHYTNLRKCGFCKYKKKCCINRRRKKQYLSGFDYITDKFWWCMKELENFDEKTKDYLESIN